MFAGQGQVTDVTVLEAQAMSTYDNTVFHHLSNFYAPSALAAVIVTAIGFGIIGTDIAFHLQFDLRLLRSPGMLQPLKALNRTAYFVMRIASLLYLGLLLFYVNVPGNDCKPFFGGLFALWYTAIVCMDFIFIARAVSLWAWRLTIAIPIFALYLTYSILGAVNLRHWGTAVLLPGTQFCGYVSQPHEAEPLRTRLNVYIALSLASDISILTLTCIRLATRGSTSNKVAAPQSTSSWPSARNAPRKPRMISQQLLVQGFVLYGSLLFSKLGFVLAYYLSDYRQSWNVMVFAMHITLNTVTAGILVRQTSTLIRKTQHHSSSMSHNSISASRSMGDGGVNCTSCQLKKMIEQAEADLALKKRAEKVVIDVADDKNESADSATAESPDKIDLELGQSLPRLNRF